jgi:uncharacterized BrkB/YihY/UPF0761 family membrane protein
MAFLLLFLWALAVVLAATLIVFVPMFETRLLAMGWIGDTALTLWKIGRHALALALLVSVFAITFRITAGKRFPGRLIWESAILTSLGWVGLGFVFSRVLVHIWQGSLLYRALGGVVGTFMWSYLCAWLLIIGACYAIRRDDFVKARARKAAAAAAHGPEPG